MVDITEPTRIQQRLDRQWDLLEDADIDDRDCEAITAFVEWRRDIDDTSRNTRRSDLKSLRLSSDRAAVPLVDMGLADVEDLLSLLGQPKSDGGYGIGKGLFEYSRALRIFFRYMDTRDTFSDYPFHEHIELQEVEMEGAGDRDSMLAAAEIEALKNAARFPRDRALIALLGDIGGRVGMVCSLRVGDVYPDGDEPYVTPNADIADGLKDLDVEEIPILHSRAELRSYLNTHHPDPEHDEAPLWPTLRGYDSEDPKAHAVGADRVRQMLAECADRADVDKPVNPHNFRRAASTRLSNSDRLTPQEIRQITGWKPSQVSEMLDVYDVTADGERNSKIHQTLGFSDGEDGDGDEFAIGTIVCGNCREANPDTSHYCANCGEALSEDARAKKREIDEATGDRAIEAEDRSAATNYERLRRWARDNPNRAVDAMLDGVGEAHD